MKKTILVCGGAVLFTALVGAVGLAVPQIFLGAGQNAMAIGIMVAAIPMVAAFIHFSFDGWKHNNHKHKGA